MELRGYLENAIHIPLDTIEKNIILTEPDKNKEIYLYCRSGNRSFLMKGHNYSSKSRL